MSDLELPWDSEDAEPLKPQRKLLEKDIQSKCVYWARSRGWWARKFSSPAKRNVPDYLFAKEYADDRSYKLAVEFKKPGGTLTKAQEEECAAMFEAGWDVRCCDDIAKFKKWILHIEAWLSHKIDCVIIEC